MTDTQPWSRREGALALVFQLRDIPLFRELSAEELLPVAEIAMLRSFGAGATIFHEGDVAQHLYLITRGEVEVLRGTRRIAKLRAREAFGIMALFDQTTRSASVVAMVPTQTILIPRDDMSELLSLYPTLGRAVARVLARRLRDANAGNTEGTPVTEA
jgi:CRP/FNR family cyclic AMP-dependent transcriptional regulator